MTFSEVERLEPPIERLPGIPEDTKYLADRLDIIAAAIIELRDATIRRELLSPTLLDILTYNGATAGELVGRHSTSLRLRVVSIIPVVTLTTTVMSLMIGQDRKFTTRVNTGSNPAPIPLPIVIDAGVDITAEIETAQAAGGRAGFYVIAYPDDGS